MAENPEALKKRLDNLIAELKTKPWNLVSEGSIEQAARIKWVLENLYGEPDFFEPHLSEFPLVSNPLYPNPDARCKFDGIAHLIEGQ